MNALLVVGLIAGMIVMIVLASVCAWCCDYFAPGSKNNKVGPAGAGEVEMNAMDAGYLIHFVHDENTSKSSVNVIDAKTMSADPVAVVELPSRVPYGLHALFVTEEQLEEQAKL
ncbi:hypothetical protein POM88_053478 [Heracleum sosnowskyi]|uniref:carotenoid 9,10-dioxygenase n=1 Tax=Heracleum sosnowskyi TaxID=360622 RepID=A0AAD8GQ59_9APIA|nr:hypothetical protein POM88_053478 [Heracleum sosnowskyi]